MLARHALHQRPVGFLRVALAKRRRQLLRRAARARHDENAGSIPVEAMHQTWLFALLAGPCFQHLVDMAADAGAALHGKPGGLVQHEHLVVLVQQHARQQLAIAGMLQLATSNRSALDGLLIDIEGRHAHHLSRLHAGIAFHAPAIDAHLAGAQQFLQRPEAEAGIVNLEPAVQPHAGFVCLDGDMLDSSHACAFVSRSAFRGCFKAFWRKGETGFRSFRPAASKQAANGRHSGECRRQ